MEVDVTVFLSFLTLFMLLGMRRLHTFAVGSLNFFCAIDPLAVPKRVRRHAVNTVRRDFLSWFTVLFHCLIAWYCPPRPRPYVIYFIHVWHDIVYEDTLKFSVI